MRPHKRQISARLSVRMRACYSLADRMRRTLVSPDFHQAATPRVNQIMNRTGICSSRFVTTTLLLIVLVLQPFQLGTAATPQGPSSMLVNSIGDEPDSAAGDGRCDTDGNAANGDQCTLRAAIQETN